MVNFPGRKRLDGIRERFNQSQRDAAAAAAQVVELRREIDGLRAEIKRLSIDLGEQMTAQAQAIEHLQGRDQV